LDLSEDDLPEMKRAVSAVFVRGDTKETQILSNIQPG
jgi:hypothetical protein